MRRVATLSLLLAFAAAAPVDAAPFCAQSVGVPPRCLFFDVAECRTEAQKSNGICSLNFSEIVPPDGPMRFCLVRNGPVIECLYSDRRSCDTASVSGRGICIDANPGARRPDPNVIPR